ncbi:MAG: HNH endonuclease family protein, partial [Ureaplasma sp.]|nr:HNH endonuclease family protein [Ureaplasma sp.]
SNFFKNLNYFFKGEETNSDGMSQEHGRFKDFKEITLKEILKISNINKDDNLTFDEFKKVLATISWFLENAFKVTYNINHHYARTHNISEILSLTDNPKKTMLCGMFCWFNTIDPNFINNSKNSKIIFETVLHIIKVTTTLRIFKNSSDSNPTKRFFEKINNEYKTGNINDLKSCKDFIINEIKISSLTKDNNLLERKDFLERLNATIKNSKTVDFQRILLLLISYKLTNNNPSETSNSKITLEHILPRKPENWIHDLREWDENLKTKTNDEIISLSENYIDSLGNLILISDNDNKKIGNKTFAEKQKKLNSFQYKNILFCSNDVNIDISKKDKWTFESITYREKYLYALIFEIYNSIF